MADTSGNTTAEIVDGIVKGVKENIAQSDKAGSEELAAAERDQAKVEQAEEKGKSAFETYKDSVAKLKSSVKQMKNTADSWKAKVAELDPESKAAEVTEQGGALSVMDALKLVDAEKEAKRAKREAEAQYFNAAMSYLGDTLSSGAGVILAAGSGDIFSDGTGTGKGVTDGVSGVLAVAAGGASALLLGTDNPLDDISTMMIEGYVALKDMNDVGEGVEEKTVDGLGNVTDYAAYATSHANGETTDPYADANAGTPPYTGPSKALDTSGPNVTVEQTADALTMPIDTFDVDHVIDEVNAAAGNGQPDTTLTGSVVTGADTPTESPENAPTYPRSDLVQNMMDQQEQGGEEPDIPDVPDITD